MHLHYNNESNTLQLLLFPSSRVKSMYIVIVSVEGVIKGSPRRCLCQRCFFRGHCRSINFFSSYAMQLSNSKHKLCNVNVSLAMRCVSASGVSFSLCKSSWWEFYSFHIFTTTALYCNGLHIAYDSLHY